MSTKKPEKCEGIVLIPEPSWDFLTGRNLAAYESRCHEFQRWLARHRDHV